MNADTSSRFNIHGWNLTNLESLLDISIGGIWGEENGASEVDVDVVRVTELKAHGVIEPSTAAKRSITKKQFQSRALEVGDLLLEKSGGGPNTPVGRVGYVLSVNSPMVCSNFMQLMRPDTKQILPIYLHLFLTFLHSNGETIPLQTSTTNIRNIKTSEYMAVKVPVPSLSEQTKIVEILEEQISRLDAALVSVRTVRVKAARFRRSLLHAAFTGALTGHEASLENSPRDWVKESVGEFASIKTGKIDVNAAVENGTYPFFTCAREIYRINEAPYEGRVVLIAGNGDLNVKYYEGKFNAYQRTYFLTVLDEMKLLPKYLYQYMEMYVEHLRKISIGTTIKYIKLGDLRDAPISVPPIAVQEKIIKILEEQLSRLESALAIADAIEKKASAMRRSLLYAAFTGYLTKEWREGAHV